MSETASPTGHPALTDEETGLPNRLYFNTVFDVVFSTGFRGLSLTVILLEADDFGQWAAETETEEVHRFLRSTGTLLRQVVRRSDVLARTDEGRFAVCLIDCNLAGGVLVADRIDGMLDSLREATGLRFSLGGAVFEEDMESPVDLMGSAEASLRTAQNKGGDKVEFHLL